MILLGISASFDSMIDRQHVVFIIVEVIVQQNV